jgi:DNA-binding SARP family transcriptional activator
MSMIVFRLLGPVGLAHQPEDSALTRLRGVRAVLATLLHHANHHVTVDRLALCVWPDPPSSAPSNLRTQIAILRQALNDSGAGMGARLTTRRGGRGQGAYRLAVAADELDATVFARLADEGHDHLANERLEQAVDVLRGALRLWYGPAGEDLPDTPAQRQWAAELTERELAAGEDLAEARLRLRDHAGLVAQLRRQLSANPHRERTAGLLIRALRATGDRTAAIAAYEAFRAQLVDDLDLEPSAQLQGMRIALLKDESKAPGWVRDHPQIRILRPHDRLTSQSRR